MRGTCKVAVTRCVRAEHDVTIDANVTYMLMGVYVDMSEPVVQAVTGTKPSDKSKGVYAAATASSAMVCMGSRPMELVAHKRPSVSVRAVFNWAL